MIVVKPYITYLTAAISIAVVALAFAWGEVSGNTALSWGIGIAWLVGIIFLPIGITLANARKRMKEAQSYVKSVRHGAIERLTGADIAKAIEKDPEFVAEMRRLAGRQLRNMILMFMIVIPVFFGYTYGLAPLIGSTLERSGLSDLARAYVRYLVYFGILFALIVAISRALRFGPEGQQISSALPYTPMRSITLFRDALILDDMYLLRAPILVKQILIDERRRFLEISLSSEYKAPTPSSRIRLYVRSPREFWEEKLSRLVKLVQQ